MNIYAVIIGTEILDGRREDKHFRFLRDILQEHGHKLYASFVIKDDKELIKNTFTCIKNDPHSILFSFGGIGSTPDDLTREIASQVFRASSPKRHEKFFNDIIEKFGDEAYPHRIHMADLPPNSKLLKNPVNNMSGFYLDERFFFMPGFPQMAHPMVEQIVTKILDKSTTKTSRLTLKAQTSENTLIDLMQQTPPSIALSSLPILHGETKEVELSLEAQDKEALEKEFNKYTDFLEKHNIKYKILKTK
jgi:molybdopterin-biosynthesis enzyme MoeA-like protein